MGCLRMIVLSVPLVVAATASTATATGHPVALIAGPVDPGLSAGQSHYKMLVLAGEGGSGLPQPGEPGKTRPGKTSGASMQVVFLREMAGSAGAKVTLEQLYSFALPAGVLKRLAGPSGRFDVGSALAGSHKNYGVINMHLASGKLKGLFHFVDVAGLSALRSSLPARIVHGSLQEAIAGGHLPETPSGTPAGCPAAGFVALIGVRPDATTGNYYSMIGVRPGLSKPVTISATDFVNSTATAPATEVREIVIREAPTTTLTVQAPSKEGNAQKGGSATLELSNGFPYLSGDLSFATEFVPPVTTCPTTAIGTVAAGPNANEGAVSNPIAQFDPGDPGSTEVKLATTPQTNGDVLMRGTLVTSP
jgi:hypothetical protein